jgi:hypothetical protein
MKLNLPLILAVAALLLAGGTVLARDIDCTGGKCVGTARGDFIGGSAAEDEISGRGGDDFIDGDPFDNLGLVGDDVIRAGAGDDVINDSSTGFDADTAFGGKGDDTIDVFDFDKSHDTVDCGPGKDTVFFDVGIDTVSTDCEVRNPVFARASR